MTRVLARPSRPLPVPPGPGLAFRQRLAAQADAALAAGAENPLRVLLEAAPGSREEEKQIFADAEALLLERPSCATTVQVSEPKTEAPMNLHQLRKAAENNDLQSMASMDLRLQYALEEDEAFQHLRSSDLDDPKAKAALKLYQDSVTLGRRNGNIDKEAFLAVMKDDPETLTELIGEGLDFEGTRNSGGHSLLQLALERGKEQCAQVLLREGARCQDDVSKKP